jgi:hypothetical protein
MLVRPSDLSLRIQTGNLSAEVGGFANFINDFIFPDPSGAVDPESGFQIFDISQGDARFLGFEAAVEYHATPWLHLRGTSDYTTAQNTTTDTPRSFHRSGPSYGAAFEGRSRLAPAATRPGRSRTHGRPGSTEDFAPAGYTLANAGAGSLPGGRRGGADLQVQNLFDKAYASF